jgi:hypothetical protein
MEGEVVMRRVPLLLLLGALVVLALASPASTAPPPAPPDPSCSPGPSDCGAWHRQDVTVTWSAPPAGVTASGCGQVTVTGDTGGAPVTCTWSNADGARSTTANVRRDSTPPAVTASPDRGPDNSGWYNHGVSVSFSGSDGTSGVAGCSSSSYSGPDSGSASVSGSCSDNAGNTGRATFELKYDATAPSAEAKAERGPDSNGWYNHAVTITFSGADSLSGLDGCGPAVRYSGPDAPKATVSGTCTDKAANRSAPANYDLRYDTRPPVLGRIRAESTTRGVVLRWTTSRDTHAVTVVRRPGVRGRNLSTVYDGKARTCTDRQLRSGLKYRYTITAYDEAGNAAVKGLAIKPNLTPSKAAAPARPKTTATVAGLSSPAAEAHVSAPPVLAWHPVPKASYYNVQLYRNGRKILTAWPQSSSFQLTSTWRFEGHAYRLSPGTYRWYVWPGFGKRSATNYGKLVGTRTFVVSR